MTKRRRPVPPPSPPPHIGFQLVGLGHPALHQPTHPVDPAAMLDGRVDCELRYMHSILEVTRGIGLAANQLANLSRICIVTTTQGKAVPLLNPELLDADGEDYGDEGCLSIPNQRYLVRRPEQVEVRAVDQEGHLVTFTATGMEARIVCHELDHLDGRLICDVGEQLA